MVFKDCHDHWQSWPRKHLDFLICRWSFWLWIFFKRKRDRPSTWTSFSVLSAWMCSRTERCHKARLLITDLLLFQIICSCFDVKLINQQQSVCHKQRRFSSHRAGAAGTQADLIKDKIKSNIVARLLVWIWSEISHSVTEMKACLWQHPILYFSVCTWKDWTRQFK